MGNLIQDQPPREPNLTNWPSLDQSHNLPGSLLHHCFSSVVPSLPRELGSCGWGGSRCRYHRGLVGALAGLSAPCVPSVCKYIQCSYYITDKYTDYMQSCKISIYLKILRIKVSTILFMIYVNFLHIILHVLFFYDKLKLFFLKQSLLQCATNHTASDIMIFIDKTRNSIIHKYLKGEIHLRKKKFKSTNNNKSIL